MIEVLEVARFKRVSSHIWQAYTYREDEFRHGSYVFERSFVCSRERPSGAQLVEEWQASIELEELRELEEPSIERLDWRAS